MTQTTTILAEGKGWRVSDVNCTAGPADPSFEEQHDTYCMAIVAGGTFAYRSSQGSATLAPGAVLLGNAGDCFRCGHDHSTGDRCLSFHFAPDYLERIVAAIPGARSLSFRNASLPPNAGTIPIETLALTARNAPSALEETAVEFAGAMAARLNDVPAPLVSPQARHAGRMADIARLIDEDAERSWQLSAMAEAAAMSPYHFVRAFRSHIGTTPYQFMLNRRLRNAALKLLETRQPVLEIALDCGFQDVSEFNRRFRRVFGQTPTALRSARRIPRNSSDRNI